MEKGYKVNNEQAYLVGGWSTEVAALLRHHTPARMELVGDWPDLSRFAGMVDSVKTLTITRGSLGGQIQALDGIDVFSGLNRLNLENKVKGGLRASDMPPQLGGLDAAWQPGLGEVLATPALRNVVLRGYPCSDLTALPASSSIETLWLANTAIASLQGIGTLFVLDELRISNASKLATLSGIESTSIRVLNVESARQLANIDALSSTSKVEVLRLLFVNERIDVSPVDRLQSLRALHIGGKDVPPIDWLSVMRLPKLETAFGWWDQTAPTEQAIRAAVPPDRQIVKFNAIGKRGLLALDVTLADV